MLCTNKKLIFFKQLQTTKTKPACGSISHIKCGQIKRLVMAKPIGDALWMVAKLELQPQFCLVK